MGRTSSKKKAQQPIQSARAEPIRFSGKRSGTFHPTQYWPLLPAEYRNRVLQVLSGDLNAADFHRGRTSGITFDAYKRIAGCQIGAVKIKGGISANGKTPRLPDGVTPHTGSGVADTPVVNSHNEIVFEKPEPVPEGHLYLEDAQAEIHQAMHHFTHNDLEGPAPVPLPFGHAEFDEPTKFGRVGSAILGVPAFGDQRVADLFYKKIGPETLHSLLAACAHALGQFHQQGIHRFAHLGNVSFCIATKPEPAIEARWLDLNNALLNKDLSLEQEIAYRTYDLMTMLRSVRHYGISQPQTGKSKP